MRSDVRVPCTSPVILPVIGALIALVSTGVIKKLFRAVHRRLLRAALHLQPGLPAAPARGDGTAVLRVHRAGRARHGDHLPGLLPGHAGHVLFLHLQGPGDLRQHLLCHLHDPHGRHGRAGEHLQRDRDAHPAGGGDCLQRRAHPLRPDQARHQCDDDLPDHQHRRSAARPLRRLHPVSTTRARST